MLKRFAVVAACVASATAFTGLARALTALDCSAPGQPPPSRAPARRPKSAAPARGAAREGEGGERMDRMAYVLPSDRMAGWHMFCHPTGWHLRAVGWQSRCRAADYARIGFPVTTASRRPPPPLLWADCLHLTGSARWHHPFLGRAREGRCVCHQARPSDGRPRRAGQRPRLSPGEPAATT
jgi:hypothetical protein